MVTGPKNSGPEKRFSGTSWRCHLHNRPSSVGHPNVIQLNINPSIDYSPKMTAERPWHRWGRSQQPAQREK